MVMIYLNQWARFAFCNLYVIEMNQENRNYYNCGSFGYLARNCRSRRIGGRIGESRRLEYRGNKKRRRK